MPAAVHYRVASATPASHRFQITLTIAQPAAQGQRLWLPDWIPGSYMIRDFARNLSGLAVVDANGQSVACHALDKSSWQCAPATGPLTVQYEVYAWDLSVRTAHLDQHHGYFNGTSLFLAVAGQEADAVTVELCCPAGVADVAGAERWRVATTLPRQGAEALGFGLYGASSYDELIDHPVEMGTFAYAEFEAAGVPHAIAVTGRFHADLGRLVRDLKVICEAQIAFFGAPAPFQQYLFQFMVVGQGYGGLEHRSSTSLLCSRDDLPALSESEGKSGERYRGLLGLCSHEYFHSWNVKQLKPREFVPYDLRREVHSELLWFFEGVTSYYDDLFLVRTGLISPASYLELLAQQITRHLRTPGRERQTVAQSSFDAWTKYYKSDENTPNSVVSYYIKGSLVALCLDLQLRQKGSSLDVVMRLLWQRFALPFALRGQGGQGGQGIVEADIRAVVTELVGPTLDAFFDTALHSTDELPWQALLTELGLTVQLRASEGASDTGGRAGTATLPRSWIGVRTQASEGGVQLSFVQAGSPAEAAGLSAGDVIVAIDELRVNQASWEKRLQQRAVGERISVYAFRRDEWLATTCQIAAAPLDTCVLPWPADMADRQAAERWLLTPSIAESL
ncbi:MAG: PDZ domain-containing protein [Pseudomonadota bacterium]